MNTRLVTPFVFLVFLVSGYSAMGYTRHYLYDEAIQEHVTNWTTTLEEGIEKPMGWETHEYLGTPEAALVISDPVFVNEMYSLYDIHREYSTEYETEVVLLILGEIDDHRWSLWDAYKKLTIFQRVRKLYYIAIFPVDLGPYNSEDWGGSLAESIASWEAAGGKREGNWMEVYKESPEYKVWLDRKFTEISGPKEELAKGTRIEQTYEPMSTEERYHAAVEPINLPFFSNLLCEDALEAYRRMVQIAYERYVVHAAEKDIVRAGIDAWAVEYAGNFLVTTGKPDFDTLDFLSDREFPFRNLVIDTCIIVGFSVVFTFFMVKKILPRVEVWWNERVIL